MATQEAGRMWNRVKKEYDERKLSHTCFQCSARYPNSGMLVQHMREEHSSFVQQATSKIHRAADKSAPADTDKYKNTIATCPFCQLDCQTRKKLMLHLQLEHKDDNEHEDEPKVKVIRIDEQNKHKLLEQLSNNHGSVAGPFLTPGVAESNMVQSFLKAMGSSNNNLCNVSNKVDSSKTAAANSKQQYKCFWCEASFRKRGKLMDHIDTLHKHNKQQNQDEADMLNMDDPSKSLSVRGSQLSNQRSAAVAQLDLPPLPYLSVSPFAPSSINGALPGRSHTESKPPPSTVSKCSFTLNGSLTNKPKTIARENTPPSNVCKFYLGKKDNPMTNVKTNFADRAIRDNNRRYSLPNVFDGSSPASYSFPYSMLPSNPLAAAAMQHNYMMNIRPQLMNATPFYSARIPMVLPSSDYLVNHSSPMLDHTQTTQQQQAQFLATISAMAQMSPLARPKASESPLDLTKSFQ